MSGALVRRVLPSIIRGRTKVSKSGLPVVGGPLAPRTIPPGKNRVSGLALVTAYGATVLGIGVGIHHSINKTEVKEFGGKK